MSELESISNQCKNHYMNIDMPDGLYPLNHKLASLICQENQNYIIEFGCNDGRNLGIIKSMRRHCTVAGIDINTKAIAKAMTKVDGHFAIGDETNLGLVEKNAYDIIFTNSVLCHMPKINKTLKQFRRIAKHSIIVCETQEVLSKYYFAHDYKGFGFEKIFSIKSVSQPLGNGAVYEIWKLKL